MVAAVVIDRELVGVHRTFLAAPGIKAFDNAKLMLGRCAGGAVRLSDGLGPLLVCEGIETGLALLSGLPGARTRTWAALSTSGVAGVILPRPPGEMVLAPDGDAPGREAAKKLADRASAAGWHCKIMRCPDGRDWNDMLIEKVAS
jgi:hypothetical protein